MESAKDEFQTYATLHLSAEDKFICQEKRDDFDLVTEVICAFTKKPSKTTKELQNDFFKLESFIQNNTYFIKIKPFHKIELRAEIFDLTKDSTLFKANITLSNSWMIIGYKEHLPLIQNREHPQISINFPYYNEHDKLPFVGSLDIKGNPVKIEKVGDVKNYLRAKKYFNEKKYELCMSVVDDILEEYPQTLFKAELIYYKIKLYAKLKDYDNVISNAKFYLKEYSSNSNIPEVLAYTAQAYAQIGLNIDADYFFDRLFSEHPDSLYTEWAYIYKGEMLEMNGGLSAALKFYKKALYKTKNIEVAATAAFNIAKAQLDHSQKDAAKYVDKIIAAKPSYFNERYKESKKMMVAFQEYGYEESAAKIANALLEAITPSYDDYELLLAKRGLWLAKTENKKQALQALNAYLKAFPDGDYLESVKVAKDELFFDTNELNATVRLAEYEKLIEEYPEDTIGDKAIYEKAKLLLTEKRYQDVLDEEEDLLRLDKDIYSDTHEIVFDAAVGIMKNALEKKKCKEVLHISKDYNITLSDEWDDGVYSCAMKGGDYQLSRKMCEKNYKSKDLSIRKKWLHRYIKVDFATGNYSDVIDASNDLIALIDENKDRAYYDVYRYLFDTYERLEQKENILSAMINLEKVFGLSYKDIDRYVSMMSLGSDRNDDTMVINYGRKVMQIEKEAGSHAQSPYVEFMLYQAYMNLENYVQALEVIKSLDSVTLKANDRARQKYLKGGVLSKLWRDMEAEKAYKAAIEADKGSAWAKLAQSALMI
jgi:hypothetical protein